VRIDTRHQWSNYWRQGHLTSLPSGFSSNYDGEFLGFWEQQFALLKPAGHMLDVCSGNGSIALLAQDFSDRHNLNLAIKAVDAANIDPLALAENNPGFKTQIAAIEFVPNTSFENFDGKAASVDLIASQYGIEYTDLHQAAENVARLLRPGGYFSVVSHCLESKIMAEMEVQQRDYARLVEMDLFAEEIVLQDVVADPNKFVEQLDATLDNIYAIFVKDRSSDVLSAAGPELEKIRHQILKDFDTGLRQFTKLVRGIQISFATSSDLLSVNRKLRQFPNWISLFTDKGLELTHTGYIHYQTKERAGKYYQLCKPA
jgi:SAM-dependent methyltransferase